MLSRSLVAVLLLAACVNARPTPGLVVQPKARAGSTELLACQIWLGWSSKELEKHCGPPDLVMSWQGHQGGSCWLYRTSARAFVGGAGAEVIGACLGSPSYEAVICHGPCVLEVYGLDASVISSSGPSK